MPARFFVSRPTRVLVCLMLAVSFAAIATGCRNQAGSPELANNTDITLDAEPRTTADQPVEAASDLETPRLVTGETNAPDATTPDLSEVELEQQIRLAAGPMADQVNSSLARLNQNLGKKEHTLLIMAMKSETRRWYFLANFVGIMNEQQFDQANEIIDSHAAAYQDLLDRRAAILENARDGQDTRQLLDFNRVAAIKLSIQVRRQLIRDVLDADQKKQYAAKFESAAKNQVPNEAAQKK